MSFSNLRKVAIHYDEAVVQNMLTMLKSAPFPSQALLDPKSPWSLGIDYDYLSSLKKQFETEWRWDRLENAINKSDNFLVDYADGEDRLQLHFLHKKSERADAIPLIMLHGWPGTFFDFHKVIEPLVNPPSPDLPAFHVVAPSLPGYFQSSLPRRDGWNLLDTAKLFNKLMTDFLGYNKYVGQGGDWGGMIIRFMTSLYPDSLVSAHFNMFPAPITDDIDRSKFTPQERRIVARWDEFQSTGAGYFLLQATKPFTIGIAVGSSPLALLAYIGEKMYLWSDPEYLDPVDVLDTVALYFLSSSFPTSVIVYNQSSKERTETRVPPPDCKWVVKSKSFGFSYFPYEVGALPKVSLEKYGNLTFYKEHTHGGHFPALDSSTELIEDLREFFGANYQVV
ncbi:alpha/beta-hydrolase [Irpex rosettiformis]|uniref:Alpha/beta-hydrolase n=1 Tax=Irpex rosettiformis TaxID=378272 RepID=A0ACB8TNC7_9APHY|nr:alpha/beta-hydrolase [Irpex rosettiformis]